MSKEIVKRYSNDDITVTWKPGWCIHSANCTNALGKVFDPSRRPWIKMDEASTEEIIKAVEGCPSKAISYERKSGE